MKTAVMLEQQVGVGKKRNVSLLVVDLLIVKSCKIYDFYDIYEFYEFYDIYDFCKNRKFSQKYFFTSQRDQKILINYRLNKTLVSC